MSGNHLSPYSPKQGSITFERADDAASGDVAYTGVGFQPTRISFTAVVFLATQHRHSRGYTTGASDNKAVCQRQTSAALRSDTSCIYIADNPGVTEQTAVLKTFDTDGFTLTWTRLGATSAGTIMILAECEA